MFSKKNHLDEFVRAWAKACQNEPMERMLVLLTLMVEALEGVYDEEVEHIFNRWQFFPANYVEVVTKLRQDMGF